MLHFFKNKNVRIQLFLEAAVPCNKTYIVNTFNLHLELLAHVALQLQGEYLQMFWNL